MPETWISAACLLIVLVKPKIQAVTLNISQPYATGQTVNSPASRISSVEYTVSETNLTSCYGVMICDLPTWYDSNPALYSLGSTVTNHRAPEVPNNWHLELNQVCRVC